MADKIRTMKKRITNKMLLFLAFCSLTACQSYYYDETKELKAAVSSKEKELQSTRAKLEAL